MGGPPFDDNKILDDLSIDIASSNIDTIFIYCSDNRNIPTTTDFKFDSLIIN